MKQLYIIFSLVVCCIVSSCQENEYSTYSGPSAIYFSEISVEDSLQYSFASGLKSEDVVSIPIKIIGPSSPEDRVIYFMTDARSTAKEGVHYKEFPQHVVLPAGQVETNIEVTVMDNDPELEDGTVDLILQLLSKGDFVLGFPENRIARLIITKQLIKPSYWSVPLSLYYGNYSKAKHRLCIQIQGFDFPDKFDTDMVGSYISYGRLVYNELLKNPIWDEETQSYITADWFPL